MVNIRLIMKCPQFMQPKATDALEMMLLSVLSPELRCDWQLESWQIASITTVSTIIGKII